jgi:CP family cyanate transporter-like MFS transporter
VVVAAPWSRLVLLWLAGMDLRLTLLAVPPVIPLIHSELALDEKGVAALSSAPILLLGLAAVPGSMLISRVGARRALLLGLTIIGLSSAARGLGTSATVLFGMTVVMGIGIAISQPTMPALVRHWFTRSHEITRATSFWSNGLLVGELLSAALTLPLILPLVGSWEWSFVVWSVPVLLTAVLVAVLTPHDAPPEGKLRPGGMPDWRSGRMWRLGILQSSASMVYFGANTFIPDYLHATNQADLVGYALAALNGGQVPASFVLGLVPLAVLARPLTSYLVAGAIVLALITVLVLPGAPLVIAAGVFGFCGAYILVLSFALPALLTDQEHVARLSAGTFTISYTIAFLVTLASGAVWDSTHIEASAFLPALIATVIVATVAPPLLRAAMSREF